MGTGIFVLAAGCLWIGTFHENGSFLSGGSCSFWTSGFWPCRSAKRESVACRNPLALTACGLTDTFFSVSSETGATTPADDSRLISNQGWSIFSRMLAGMFLYGAIGFGIGSWLGDAILGMSIGSIAGLGCGLLVSILTIRTMSQDDDGLRIPTESQSWSSRMTRARINQSRQRTTS